MLLIFLGHFFSFSKKKLKDTDSLTILLFPLPAFYVSFFHVLTRHLVLSCALRYYILSCSKKLGFFVSPLEWLQLPNRNKIRPSLKHLTICCCISKRCWWSHSGRSRFLEIPLLEPELVVSVACLRLGDCGGCCPLRVQLSAEVLAFIDARIFGYLKALARKPTRISPGGTGSFYFN